MSESSVVGMVKVVSYNTSEAEAKYTYSATNDLDT